MIDARRGLEECIAQQQLMLAEIANVINTAYGIEQKALKAGAPKTVEWSAAVTVEVQAMWAIFDEHALNLWVLMEAVEGRARGPSPTPAS